MTFSHYRGPLSTHMWLSILAKYDLIGPTEYKEFVDRKIYRNFVFSRIVLQTELYLKRRS